MEVSLRESKGSVTDRNSLLFFLATNHTISLLNLTVL